MTYETCNEHDEGLSMWIIWVKVRAYDECPACVQARVLKGFLDGAVREAEKSREKAEGLREELDSALDELAVARSLAAS